MAKKTRKVLKQESRQRAIQQAVANVSTTTVVSDASVAVAQPSAARSAPARTSGLDISAEQEFNYVRTDVRKSLSLAAIFTVILVALSFVIR